ncbi:unnamed protein product, partial [Effrenium voratum]
TRSVTLARSRSVPGSREPWRLSARCAGPRGPLARCRPGWWSRAIPLQAQRKSRRGRRRRRSAAAVPSRGQRTFFLRTRCPQCGRAALLASTERAATGGTQSTAPGLATREMTIIQATRRRRYARTFDEDRRTRTVRFDSRFDSPSSPSRTVSLGEDSAEPAATPESGLSRIRES